MADEAENQGGTEQKQPQIPTKPFKRGSGAKAYVDTDTLVAEIEAGEHEKPAGKGRAAKPGAKSGTPAPEKKNAAPPPDGDDKGEEKETPDDEEEESGKEDDDGDQVDDEETDDADDADEEEDGEEVELSAAQKAKLKGLQRAEMKQKAELAKERTEVEKQRGEVDRIVAKWQPKIEQFEKLTARVKYDAAGVLEALGLTADDFEPVARELYARSKAGEKNPKHREAALATQRDREKDARIAELEKFVKEIKEGNAEKEQTAEVETRVAAYLGKVEKVAKNPKVDAPLVRKMLETKPDKARARLYATANRLADEMGGLPDMADVVEALEAERLEELEEIGIDPATILAGKPEKPAPAANGKKPARTLRPGGGGAATPPARQRPQSRDALFEEIADELEAGKDQENRLQ